MIPPILDRHIKIPQKNPQKVRNRSVISQKPTILGAFSRNVTQKSTVVNRIALGHRLSFPVRYDILSEKNQGSDKV
jgi:hypothetical protein